jgi:uncharacterized FlaG/YvyC family protein
MSKRESSIIRPSSALPIQPLNQQQQQQSYSSSSSSTQSSNNINQFNGELFLLNKNINFSVQSLISSLLEYRPNNIIQFSANFLKNIADKQEQEERNNKQNEQQNDDNCYYYNGEGRIWKDWERFRKIGKDSERFGKETNT